MQTTTRPLLAGSAGVGARVGVPLQVLGGGRYRCPVTSLTHVATDGVPR
jgi:hypothetical protein